MSDISPLVSALKRSIQKDDILDKGDLREIGILVGEARYPNQAVEALNVVLDEMIRGAFQTTHCFKISSELEQDLTDLERHGLTSGLANKAKQYINQKKCLTQVYLPEQVQPFLEESAAFLPQFQMVWQDFRRKLDAWQGVYFNPENPAKVLAEESWTKYQTERKKLEKIRERTNVLSEQARLAFDKPALDKLDQFDDRLDQEFPRRQLNAAEGEYKEGEVSTNLQVLLAKPHDDLDSRTKLLRVPSDLRSTDWYKQLDGCRGDLSDDTSLLGVALLRGYSPERVRSFLAQSAGLEMILERYYKDWKTEKSGNRIVTDNHLCHSFWVAPIAPATVAVVYSEIGPDWSNASGIGVYAARREMRELSFDLSRSLGEVQGVAQMTEADRNNLDHRLSELKLELEKAQKGAGVGMWTGISMWIGGGMLTIWASPVLLSSHEKYQNNWGIATLTTGIVVMVSGMIIWQVSDYHKNRTAEEVKDLERLNQWNRMLHSGELVLNPPVQNTVPLQLTFHF